MAVPTATVTARPPDSETNPRPDRCDLFSSETRVMRKRRLTFERKAQKLQADDRVLRRGRQNRSAMMTSRLQESFQNSERLLLLLGGAIFDDAMKFLDQDAGVRLLSFEFEEYRRRNT
jgi:hypothetical protein